MRVGYVLAFACGCSLLGCGSSKPPPPVGVSTVQSTERKAPVRFEYDSLDERPVSSAAMKGKLSVIAFITTWDLSSQAQVDYLVPMSKRDGDQVAYALVALQPRRDRELIELYRTKLGVTFPVALGDAETISGSGAFGDVHAVPTVIILDREGRVVWRNVGLVKADEIRRELRSHP
ncbi:TlpA family protein disulfide reductase [Pendulispora rubella]|uniref:TlpA family protein disulfide reductase n=1 Tax=Pendulispora rubella TaxID=2741070 RepID=A0ABZ2LB84_9BACT